MELPWNICPYCGTPRRRRQRGRGPARLENERGEWGSEGGVARHCKQKPIILGCITNARARERIFA